VFAARTLSSLCHTAASHDGGYTWVFQQEVLQLRAPCPSQLNKEPDGSKDNNPFNLANNSENGDDDGQGHQFVPSIGGHTYLYTLERASDHIQRPCRRSPAIPRAC